MDEQEKTFKSVIEKYSVPCLCETLQVFPQVDLSEFAPENLSKFLSNQLLRWRIGKRQSSELQWEPSCLFQKASISQVIEWNCITNCHEPSPSQKELQDTLKACCPEHYWCYADYMYMKDVFLGPTDVLNKLKWQELGFTNKTGHDSTIWIGTAGAHTLCHYDTYGYNIVIQISGSKRWVLFPPSDMDLLYPTRIPYEESTVFSEVNLSNPDLSHHPRFREASACTVVLRPGDILYVPRHWWHYVENLELSVSINLWCEMESDAEDRFTESVTRLMLGTMAHTLGLPEDEAWISPNESIASLMNIEKSLEFMSKSLQETSVLASRHLPPDENNIQQIFHHGSNPILIKPMKPVNFMENTYFNLISAIAKASKCQTSSSHYRNATMKCSTHPKVIKSLAMVLLERIKNNACDVASISHALSSPGSTSTWTNTSSPSINTLCACSSEISEDVDDSECSVDEPCTLRERSSSIPGTSLSLDDRELTRTPIGCEHSSGEVDIRSKNVKDTSMVPTPQVISEKESDCFEFENMSSDRTIHFAESQFPLTTISGVRDFEKRLKEGDSTLMDMIKYNDASSLEAYFDYVIPKLLADNLLSQYKTTSRAEGVFSFSDEVFHAIQEKESDCFEFENMSSDRTIHFAESQFPLTTISGVRDFEKRLKEGDSTLMDMIKYNDASSLEAYFDYVIPKLLADNLLSQYKTTSRAEGVFSFSDEVFHAIQEALQGNATLKNSKDSLISRCLRIWVSTQQRKFRHRKQKLLKRCRKQGQATQPKRSCIR